MFDKEYLERIREEKEKWDKNVENIKERTDLPFVSDSDIFFIRSYKNLVQH